MPPIPDKGTRRSSRACSSLLTSEIDDSNKALCPCSKTSRDSIDLMISSLGSAQTPTSPRILLVSARGLRTEVSRCLTFEFEDAITRIDRVHLFAPGLVDRRAGLFNKVLKTIGPWTGTDLRLRPLPVRRVEVSAADFELTLVVVQTVRDLRDLMRIRGWRGVSPKTVCLVEELWVERMTKEDVSLLGEFDHVILSCHHSTKPLSERIQTPVTYLPPSVDMLRFSPADLDKPRPIDVYSMGRRLALDHQLLMQRSRDQDFYYVYDSACFTDVQNPAEHRELLANTIQRTKWFPVNRAKVTEPCLSAKQPELGFRYFEGAAAGTVMIGERPSTPAFEECFGWTDSVITPTAGESILDVIDMLEADPARAANIRRRNVAHSLRRHDSSDRFRDILRIAGLEASAQLEERVELLRARAASLDADVSVRAGSWKTE